MFERFTQEARTLVALASEHARRLGHRYVGGEHILLAAVSAGEPTSAVLRAHGVTPELVEEEIVHRVGLGAGPACSAAWTRTRWPRSGSTWTRCGPGSRPRSGRRRSPARAEAAHRDLRRRPGPRPPRRVREWRRRRRDRRVMATLPAPGPRLPEATGRYCAPGPRPSGHIPFTPAAKKILELTLREAVARQDSQIGVEHIALALTTIKQGLVPQILSAAGAPAAALRTAILDRYRQAS